MNLGPDQTPDPLNELLRTARFPAPDSQAADRLRAVYTSERLRVRRAARNRRILIGALTTAAAVVALVLMVRSIPSGGRNEMVHTDVPPSEPNQPPTAPIVSANQPSTNRSVREPSPYERLLVARPRQVSAPPRENVPPLNAEAAELMNRLRDPLVSNRLDAARDLGAFAADPQVATRLLNLARNDPGVAREALAALSFAGDAAFAGLDSDERATLSRRMKTAAAVLAEHTRKGEPQ